MLFAIAALSLTVGFIVGGAWPKSEIQEPAPVEPASKIDVLA
jgi:hypothetical protein